MFFANSITSSKMEESIGNLSRKYYKKAVI